MKFNKMKWILGVSLVFFLIIATNFIDRNNFTRVKDSIVNIYEDRLVAKGIVFDISVLIHEKDIANKLIDTSFYTNKNTLVNNQIEELLLGFEATELIVEERKILESFILNFDKIKELESEYINNSNDISSVITEIKVNLNDLTKIQIEEGRKQMFIGKKAVDSVELLTHMEVYLLIFLAIVIQILIIYNPKKNN